MTQVKMQSEFNFSGLLYPLCISCKSLQQAQFLDSEINWIFFLKKKNEIFKYFLFKNRKSF